MRSGKSLLLIGAVVLLTLVFLARYAFGVIDDGAMRALLVFLIILTPLLRKKFGLK
ncbi:hypothetical protein [Exiguobacterium flavidum]|uniref:hypothetical protein n=1 Tax=Exiguobacterium flavidum TaxID=2184695 RepID=UPI001300742D|nr:hypothetical protein [Exiguobacterium flavidum]